jgi:hypothetical protein
LYQAENGDWWTYNLKTGNWAYYDSAAATTFGAQGTIVYALEKDGSVLQYNSNLAVDAFQYTSPNGQDQVYYFPD